jgi:hypothetical protein
LTRRLDRFARNPVDQERMVWRFESGRIPLIRITDGYSSVTEGRDMMRAMRDSFHEQLLRDIAKKPHPRLIGQVGRRYPAVDFVRLSVSVVVEHDARGFRSGTSSRSTRARSSKWAKNQYLVSRWLGYQHRRRTQRQRRAETARRHASHERNQRKRGEGSGGLNNELYVGSYICKRSQRLKAGDPGADAVRR